MNPLLDAKDSYKLIKFELVKQMWGEHKGEYKCKVKFGNDAGDEFNINIDDNTVTEVLRLVAPDLAFATQSLAEDMMNAIRHQIIKGNRK